MKFWLLILLLGVCSPQWTTAKRNGRQLRVENHKLIEAVQANSTHIDLSNRGIREIDNAAFNDLGAIKSLDLSHNELSSLKASIFSGLPNLEKLSLKCNKIKSFSNAFRGLNNLTYVDMSSNDLKILERNYLSGLPESAIIYFGRHNDSSYEPIIHGFDDDEEERSYHFTNSGFMFKEKLQEDDSVNDIICKTADGLVKSVGDGSSVREEGENKTLINCMKKNMIGHLSTLYLNDLGLQKFGRNWCKLTLKGLGLHNNNITDITPELLNDLPSTFSNINLQNNSITIIRQNIIVNRYIELIWLDDNLISTVEVGAFKNTSLITLYLRRNHLNDLTFVKTLPATLRQLYLSQNSFRVIPTNTFQGLKELNNLDLGDSGVEIIQPGAFEDLESVTQLYLSYNQISELKPGAFRGLEKLKTLNLDYNKIKTIPQGVISRNDMPNIHAIYLRHNQIDTIETKSLSYLTLSGISLAMNNITEKSIAKDAFEASTIRFLELENNLFSEIDESFPNLSGIETLVLVKNHIRSIKIGAMKNAPNLKTLDLSDNPLNHLENGALSGLSSKDFKIGLLRVPIEYIGGGVFNDISN